MYKICTSLFSHSQMHTHTLDVCEINIDWLFIYHWVDCHSVERSGCLCVRVYTHAHSLFINKLWLIIYLNLFTYKYPFLLIHGTISVFNNMVPQIYISLTVCYILVCYKVIVISVQSESFVVHEIQRNLNWKDKHLRKDPLSHIPFYLLSIQKYNFLDCYFRHNECQIKVKSTVWKMTSVSVQSERLETLAVSSSSSRGLICSHFVCSVSVTCFGLLSLSDTVQVKLMVFLMKF